MCNKKQRLFRIQGLQSQLPLLDFSILVIVASDIIVELPDILFDSIGDDPNLIFDAQN